MANKFYYVCTRCKKEEAIYLFQRNAPSFWEDGLTYAICKRCRLYEKLKCMSEEVTSRVKILTVDSIRYVQDGVHGFTSYTTVKEDKTLHRVISEVRRIKNGKTRRRQAQKAWKTKEKRRTNKEI